MNKITYKTRQKEELLEYLRSNNGRHITVHDICEHFKSSGNAIGLTTVYRHLERMVDEGIVSKYIIDSNTPACFEYISEGEHGENEVCFHCKCEKCGRLIHMHCDELNEIKDHLFSHHGFNVNSMRTVFYGVCKDCSK